jgi:hypothetical protein
MNAVINAREFGSLVCYDTPVAPLVDAEAVTRSVRNYARRAGCDGSNTQAAIAWALRYGVTTFDACRKGRDRADQLKARQGFIASPRGAA